MNTEKMVDYFYDYRDGGKEYEVHYTALIAEAEPDVGIMQPYVEERDITKIVFGDLVVDRKYLPAGLYEQIEKWVEDLDDDGVFDQARDRAESAHEVEMERRMNR